MTRKLTLLFFFSASCLFAYSQTGCPGCIVNLPDTLSADTIYLSDAPSGQAGVYYEGDLSFRMPKTTTPVTAIDPDVPPGLTISKITISGVSNVPPGLSWEPSQMEFNTSDGETDGCVRFCGVPLQPGLYMVDVIITARLVIIDQTASFTVPILIEPAESTTDGFNMVNNSGCGSVQVSFENNVPSNGKVGYSYNWDFGNGVTSTDENPADQLYDLPGEYPVQYQAKIDTTGYFLTRVNINAVDCNDLLGGRPDLKLNIFNPAGDLIYVSDIITNAHVPVAYELNLPLEEGNYALAVTDDDSGLGGADDQCGTVTFNRNTTGNLSDGGLALTMEILHPVDIITSTGTVYVYDQPDPPLITAPFESPLCEGDTVQLIADYTEHIQWYRDSVPVLGGTGDTLVVTQSGSYRVVYTSPDGCISMSEEMPVSFGKLPETVSFVNENNELSLFDPDKLPESYQINWYQNGDLLEGFNETTYCIDSDATYTIEVVDLSTECSASYSQAITFDPDYPNCVSPVIDQLPNGVASVQIFPNPTLGPLHLVVNTNSGMEVELSLYSLTGRRIQVETKQLIAGKQDFSFELGAVPAGMYILSFSRGGKTKNWRIVKAK
ncbi:MAG: T9SS type A sorting domain-containing protein [Saprospiraceae bacterium]